MTSYYDIVEYITKYVNNEIKYMDIKVSSNDFISYSFKTDSNTAYLGRNFDNIVHTIPNKDSYISITPIRSLYINYSLNNIYLPSERFYLNTNIEYIETDKANNLLTIKLSSGASERLINNLANYTSRKKEPLQININLYML